MELFKNWATTLCVTLIFISVANIILPNNVMKGHVKFALSLILLATMMIPIIQLLTLGNSIDTSSFDNVTNIVEENKDINNHEVYSNDLLKENLEKTLVKTLRERYKDKEFEVKIEGDIDIASMNINISKVRIGVTDPKKIKKVDKIVIGENTEGKAIEEDSFIKELKGFISEELKIPRESIKVNYL